MDMVNVVINGIAVQVPKGSTILEAARVAGVDVPTLCYLKKINEIAACRICVVEAAEMRGASLGPARVVTSCVYPVSEGMQVRTNTEKIRHARKNTLELILSTHDRSCLSCKKTGDCELQRLCIEYDVNQADRFDGDKPVYEKDENEWLVRDNNKCILCRRCVASCAAQSVSVIGANQRGFDTNIGCAFEKKLSETACMACGQCVVACPTGALMEHDNTKEVFAALGDAEKTVIVHTAPAVRATLGEAFGLPVGTNVEGKMAAALRRLGFDRVFDTNFAADLTIWEEATELLERIKNKGTLPMITSCSPGWVKFCEHQYPDLIDHLSSCKSPQQMASAIIKTYYAQKAGIDPEKLVVVSVMPCIAKKFEIRRENQDASGAYDTDYSITTRELARMIKTAGINFSLLPDEAFDNPLSAYTGGAVIFGATGGVMEAAVRYAYEALEGKPLEDVDLVACRGTDLIKEATVHMGGMDVKVAITSGGAGARIVMDKIASGEADWTFVEIMGCPGGCVNGGGQPFQPASVRANVDLKSLRAKALYTIDEHAKQRSSQQSEVCRTLYQEFLGAPGSEKAHHLLHTTYVKRGV